MRWIVTLSALALIAAASAAASGTGIGGRVTASPTCPVETMPPQPGCEPRGFVARVRVRRASDRRLVRTLTTRSDGRFSTTLRPGRYLVSARPASGQSLPRCPPAKTVRVASGRMARVAIDCDSGIR
jgi:hypothetical protein